MEGTVSNLSTVRNNTNEELDRTKFGQSDERTIYKVQHGSRPLHVDYCSITIEDGGGLDNDILQQRIHSVYRQREDLQNMEVELRAQIMARSGIMEMKNSFEAQIKEHLNASEKLKEQLQESESIIHELELQMEEKDRELRAIKIDNEAAWAKEDLLREQNKELATFRRELDNSEAERAQLLKQIHDLKEYIQEKERQILELEEQQRVAQEAITYKDEQLRDAQAWIARAQEVDALQSTAIHSLQAELRERTEQFNQFWVGCQRQFADMERHHLQTIQQLQSELAEARERSGTFTDESRIAHAHSKDASLLGENRGNQLNVKDGGTVSGNSEVLTNGDVDNDPHSVATGNASHKTEHVPGVSVVPPSLIGMGAYLPPGLHPFVMHQQGIPQSHMEHCQPIPTIISHQHWPNHQVASEGSHVSNQDPYQPSPTGQNVLIAGDHYDYKFSVNEESLSSGHLDAQISPGQEPGALTSSEEAQHAKQYLQEGASKIRDALKSNSLEQRSETKKSPMDVGFAKPRKDHCVLVWLFIFVSFSICSSIQSNHRFLQGQNETTIIVTNHLLEGQSLTMEQLRASTHSEPTLLDERSLLVCIVRAIPAGSGGRIRISSTLSNRLGKMLVPFHWHDYKKKYGKLDDFVTGHPELFVIEGDFIQLREGAQEIISATTAIAKVAAAAAASTPYSSSFPSIAVTPVAQNHRLKKPSQPSIMKNQSSNDECYNVVQGLASVKISSKPKDPLEINGVQSEARPTNSSVGNGAVQDRTRLGTSQNKGDINGRHGMSFVGKHQGRVLLGIAD
ncbi:hypothetical protein BVC80_1719g81 [Macleaya cordata]|uniref:DUF7725 domain-containing protein n=1 Tax=Macleaya cordata TaxID=56857 RepID=A0A200Q2Q2_MACCD|nr:hypothetical protein BVC80_1719g81 [Macleaya cordata]